VGWLGAGDAVWPVAVFIEYLKQGGLFDGWVASCPLHFTSPNAPSKRDVLGTVLLSVLAGHRRHPRPAFSSHICNDVFDARPTYGLSRLPKPSGSMAQF
jgi:hypothetical protein